jgi:putative endonuclease
MNTPEIGLFRENLACEYLVNNKYRILDRNYHEKFGEIDIITKSPHKTLVSIEIKMISEQKISVDKSPARYPHLARLSGKTEYYQTKIVIFKNPEIRDMD